MTEKVAIGLSFMLSKDLVWQYSFVITLVGMIAMAANRSSGMGKAWKISDLTLGLIALVGAAPGELLYMLLFRYKWENRLFSVGIPMLSIIHVLTLIILYIHL